MIKLKILFIVFLIVFISLGQAAEAFLEDFLLPEAVFQQPSREEIPEKNLEFRWRAGLISAFYGFSDADFSPYRHRQYVQNRSNPATHSDDASFFLLSSAVFEGALSFQGSFLKIQAYQSGLWGSDLLEGRDESKSGLLFRELFFLYNSGHGFLFSLGRQRFVIGHALRDYFFDDTVDGLKLIFSPAETLSLTFLVDVPGISSSPEGYLYGSMSSEAQSVTDFQGDTLSLRLTLVSDLPYFKTFHTALRYGATEKGGADRAENGKNSLNKADGDFLMVNGLRGFYEHGVAGSFDVTLAHSYGKDFLYRGEKTYGGIAGVLNWQKNWIQGFKTFFSGGFFSSGFAGMKARSMGGSLLYGYLGYFASPYAGPEGFLDRETTPPSRPDRTCSKTFIRMEAGFEPRNFSIFVSGLILWQTLSEGRLSYMGIEGEAGGEWRFSLIQLRLSASVFFPSGYYRNLAFLSGELSGKTRPFYGLSFSASCFFQSR